MTFAELRKGDTLDPEFRAFSTKRDLVNCLMGLDGRTRVGGPKGKGRLTAKKTLALLGVRV
jgi:hypothetical protein